jgi:imidazolonepropionase-like amidohydrolase
MTSNLGSNLLQDSKGGAIDEDTRKRMLNALREHFRPEFLNRIDDMVVFARLTMDDLTQVVDIQLERVKKLLADRKIVVDQTLATFNFIRQKDGELSQEFAAVADHVPPDVRRGFYAGQIKIPDEKTYQRYSKSYAKMIEFTGRMYRAGVPLVAGTDDIAGFTLQRELELLVEAGLTPAQVLQVATYNGAKYARVLDDRGVIMPGKRADLILVDGDPVANISDIRKVALVVKGEVAYYPADLLEAQGVKPFTPALRVQ